MPGKVPQQTSVTERAVGILCLERKLSLLIFNRWELKNEGIHRHALVLDLRDQWRKEHSRNANKETFSESIIIKYCSS